LERLPGVKRATVSREKEEARVEYDDGKMSPEKLVAAIGRLGFQASLLEVLTSP
jgi:copper chaperone CopZ